MPPTRFEPSLIKNRHKRGEVFRSQKKARSQEKLKKRLARAEAERKDPSLKQRRLSENVPRTLDNTREFTSSIVPVVPVPGHEGGGRPSNYATDQADNEDTNDIASKKIENLTNPVVMDASESASVPKILITTSQKATKASFEFCNELLSVFPGAEFIRRKRGHGFEMGRIAGWAGKRGYQAMMVVNEDHKKPNAMTIIRLPDGPTAYFKLSSVQPAAQIFHHARPTTHYPELVLNGFVTQLGITVGQLFQTLFPVMPEFAGRQVVTLHNQRDFIFFRRHRYAFRSTEKAALQEIGPRFTLKLRSLQKGVPAVETGLAPPPSLQFADDEDPQQENGSNELKDTRTPLNKQIDNNPDFEWVWKPELETTRRTFFL